MSQSKIARLLVLFGLICLVILGIAAVRSCHTPEDPQHFQEDDVTAVEPAPTGLRYS